jgi:hydroxymethylpyrimidine/phosphomethylpyrimidine kinase
LDTTSNHRNPPVALTIAGSDSGGGAGIQADLKTFAAHHVFGTCAITAVTAQNTVGVQDYKVVDPDLVDAQIRSVLSDFWIRGSKTGMLATREIVQVVSNLAKDRTLHKLVVDPVMVAASGDPLIDSDAIEAYIDLLFPHAYLITPNAPEASKLVGLKISDAADLVTVAKELKQMGPANVLVKGGHLEGDPDAIDVLYDGDQVITFRAARIESKNTHGTGCTLSASITANLARGVTLTEAVREAKAYVTSAIAGSKSWALGHGFGPLDHFNSVVHHY